MSTNGKPTLTQTLGLISGELARGNNGYAANVLNELIITLDRMPKAEYHIVKAYKCVECQEITEDLTDPLRECPHCEKQFVSSERECPDCNRPFTRKVADHGCPSCEDGELEEIEIIGKCAHCDTPLELADVEVY